MSLAARLARLSSIILALGVVLATSVARADDDGTGPDSGAPLVYDFIVDVKLLPTERSAHVTLEIGGSGARNMRRMAFNIDPERHTMFEGDGRVMEETEGELVWEPPLNGGKLHYVFRIDHLKDDRQYDGRCATSWALFRGDDLVPSARVRTEVGARSNTRVRLTLPKGWKATLPYPEAEDGSFMVENPDRRFDRPTGWWLLGKTKNSEANIAGSHIRVGSPKGRAFRQQDMLALLRWALPELKKVIGPLPKELLIVGAGDPMWRGGLSGPGTVYLHGDRPLIEASYTSPILHEMVHTVMRARAERDGDWAVEGLAEYYSIELLYRSGTIDDAQRQLAFEKMAKRAKKARTLRVARSYNEITARAVLVLKELDEEIRARTGGKKSLDDVFAALVASPDALSTERFRTIANKTSGLDLSAFYARHGLLGPGPEVGTPPPAPVIDEQDQ